MLRSWSFSDPTCNFETHGFPAPRFQRWPRASVPSNSVSLQLDPSARQSIDQVKDNITQASPFDFCQGHWRWCRHSGCNWPFCPPEPSDVSANVRAAVHRENPSDGERACAEQTVCPHERTC